jgi:phosphatidylethanolamine/phosphatidyl-N-methylethanolamine N-methyltransferase
VRGVKASGRRVGERRKFFREFLRRPHDVGAVLPSSDDLGRVMVADVGLEAAHAIAELGPGTGVFTRMIAQNCRPDALVLVFEINAQMARPLVAEFPRFHIVSESAETIGAQLQKHGRASVECVISSLPWAAFPSDLQERLLGAVSDALVPGGRFATFAYISGALLPQGRALKRLLQRHFSLVERTPIVWLNTPPAFVYRCTK